MTQVINTSDGGSGAGVALGILLAIAIGLVAFFVLRSEGDVDLGGGTDINIEAPATPAAPAE